jgi:hypothetical protein
VLDHFIWSIKREKAEAWGSKGLKKDGKERIGLVWDWNLRMEKERGE